MTTTPEALRAAPPHVAARRGPRVGRWAIGLIVGGVVLRGAVLLAGLPPTNSDEAFMGLMARHIAAGVSAPVWFYGQEYMAPIEAWIAAPLFALFGSSTGLLRVQTLAWYALMLVLMYRLTVRVYSRRVALLTVGLLALGSDRIFKNQLLTLGGYPEIVPMAAALFLLSVILCAGRQSARRSAALFGLWGLVAGVAVWDVWLVLPYVAAAGLLLVAFRGRDLVRLPGLALLAGALTGAAPMIVDNLIGNTNSLWWFAYLNAAGHSKLGGATIGDHLYGGVIIGIPMGTGMCLPSECTPAHLWWGPAYLALLLAAVALAVRFLRRYRGAAVSARRARVRHATRLALALAALVSIVSYTRSPSAVLHPIESARYLSLLVLAVPVVLWPLLLLARAPVRARGSGTAAAAPGWGAVARRLGRLAGRSGVVVIVAMALVATVAVVTAGPEAQRQERIQAGLVAELDRQRVTAIYSDYWTCARLAFATDERIICATIEEDLISGHDRYLPYRERVAADPGRAYVMRRGGQPDRQLAAYVEQRRVPVSVDEVDGYRIYRSGLPLGLPKSEPKG